MSARYLLDTNIVSDMIRNPDGRATQAFRRLSGPSALTSVIVLAELKFGAERTNSDRLRRGIATILLGLDVAPLEPPVDDHYAKLRTALERAGRPISANDMWIAAHALALDCTLVTANEREFRRVQGLTVENWLA